MSEEIVKVEYQETTLTRCEELLAKAQAGEKLDADTRRDVIQYLMATQPHMTNTDMARLFNLSEGMIRKDKDIVRKRAADDISKEDVGLVIGDIRRTYERFIADIQRCLSDKKLCPPGTKTYLDYQRALVDYQLKIVGALQSLGFYPKNLGTMQQTKFVFKSTVQKDGSIETKAIDATTKHKIIDAKIGPAIPDPVEDSLRDELRDEFSETPTGPRLADLGDTEQYESEP